MKLFKAVTSVGRKSQKKRFSLQEKMFPDIKSLLLFNYVSVNLWPAQKSGLLR